MKRFGVVLLLAVLLTWPKLGHAAEIADLLGGKVVPLTMQFKDLDQEWRRVSVGGQVEAGNPLQIFSMLTGGAGSTGAYYTKGQTVTVANETFLLAYRVRTNPVDMAALMERGPRAMHQEKLTPETTLVLSLLNLRAVASLNDIRPFDLKQEIAESEKMAEAMGGQDDRMAGSAEPNAVALSNLKQMALATIMWSQDHDTKLPPMKDIKALQEALEPYVKTTEIFVDPATKQPFQVNPALSSKKIGSIKDPSAVVILYQGAAGSDGRRAAAFVDGHARLLTADAWEKAKKASNIK